jgi:predicted kinase
LIRRGERGLIRRTHGDLHLGNIVMLDGRPVLFDAIEFSELIASGDLLYDLAFLLMDLIERKLPQAANIVFNRYLTETQRTDDLDALAALPFFLSIRAQIRAKVTAARLAQADRSQHAAIARTARSYFDWARRFIKPPAPSLVAVGGLSGTGKSVLARGLAPELGAAPGAVVLRSDVERKALAGRKEDEALPQDAYTPAMTLRVYATLAEKAKRVLAAGHSAIADAVFARPEERAAIEASADAAGVPFHGLFLELALEQRVARVSARHGDASDADAKIARDQERYDLGPLTWRKLDASGTSDETLARATDAIARTTCAG